MAKITVNIITEDKGKKQEKTMEFVVKDQKKWEEENYKIGCAVAREITKQGLKLLDEELFEEHPESWKSEGFQKRTRVTRFGSFKVKRRIYVDKEGKWHFLLDEYLQWPAYLKATPSFIGSVMELSSQIPFGQVVETLKKLVAGVLSRSTIHRMLQEITGYVTNAEKAQWEFCFQEAVLPESGKRKVPILFVEVDGVWVHNQQENQKHYELKNGIVYEGWELIGDERYALVNKRVYSHSDPIIPFWEGISLMMDRYWDMSSLKLLAIGGDGANWVESGKEEMPFSVFQCSGFHLSRACGIGWENGSYIYNAIRNGESIILNQKEQPGEKASKARCYVLKRLKTGMDWRKQIHGFMDIPPGARSLGAIESNEDKIFANRMKKRGLSWTISGAQKMGKGVQLTYNGEWTPWCKRDIPKPTEQKGFLSFDLFHESDKKASLPALESPEASRPWGRAIKDLVFPNPLLN